MLNRLNNASICRTPAPPTAVSGSPSSNVAGAGDTFDAQPQRFKFKLVRSWMPFAAPRPQLPHAHSHHGGGTVPIDLDETANGIAASATKLGLSTAAKVSVLGVGIGYSFHGAWHSLEDIRALPGNLQAIDAEKEAISHAINDTAPKSPVYPNSVQKNGKALLKIRENMRLHTLGTGMLAYPSFIGCLGMGSSLLCAPELLGLVAPAAASLATPLMWLAVPPMALYALGAFVLAVMGSNRQQGFSAPITKALEATKELDADHAVRKALTLAKSQIIKSHVINGATGVAALMMGVGIVMVAASGPLWLAVMIPGALGLPLLQGVRGRYIGYTPEYSIDSLVSLGGKKLVANEINFLDAQERLLETLKAKTPGRLRRLFGAPSNPSETLRLAMFERAKATASHLRLERDIVASRLQTPAMEQAAQTRLDELAAVAARLDAVQAWLAPASAFDDSVFATRSILDMLGADGLGEEFALLAASDHILEPHLKKSLRGQEIGLSNKKILAMLEQADGNELAGQLFDRVCELAVRAMTSRGLREVREQKRELVDLFATRL